MRNLTCGYEQKHGSLILVLLELRSCSHKHHVEARGDREHYQNSVGTKNRKNRTTTAKLRLQVDSDPPLYAHELGFPSRRNTLFKINA